MMMMKGTNTMVDESMSNLTFASNNEASISSGNRDEQSQQQQQPAAKKRRSLPGNPEPGAEVIALSPTSLLATNRFLCEACGKGFQRDQNLQLHRRGHNLPWKLKQRNNKEVVRRKVYVCPEVTCVHHDPSRALGDLTGIKKHFCRKHGEKKWKCEKCSKRYAVQSDWKAHSKICGTREYRCDCGTLFSRRDSFITHRAFCDALSEENARTIITSNPSLPSATTTTHHHHDQINLLQSQFHGGLPSSGFSLKREHDLQDCGRQYPVPLLPSNNNNDFPSNFLISPSLEEPSSSSSNPNNNKNPLMLQICSNFKQPAAAAAAMSPHMSATALLQKATQMGVTMSGNNASNHQSAKPMLIRPHQVHMITETTTGLMSSTSLASSVAGCASVGFGLSTREEMGDGFIHGLESFGNKPVIATSSSNCMEQQVGASTITTTTEGGGGGGVGPPPLLLHHDMIMPSAVVGFGEGSADGNNNNGIFSGIFSPSSNRNMMMIRNLQGIHPRPPSYNYYKDIGGGGNEGLTRDFLGLTVPFPSSTGSNRDQCDLFMAADLHHHHQQIGSSSYNDQHHQNHQSR